MFRKQPKKSLPRHLTPHARMRIIRNDMILLLLITLLLLLFLSLAQAAKDTKHRMGPAADQITILHFNDVYNVEPREQVSHDVVDPIF